MEFTVKTPKLNCAVAVEKTVEVKEMVAAVVVVRSSAFAVSLVPKALNLRHCGWLPAVDFVYQNAVHLFAVSHSFRCNLQSLVEKVILACDDVDKVSQAPWGMACAIKVDVNAAGVVCKAASFSNPSYQLLQGIDVFLVSQNRADQLNTVIFPCCNFLSALLPLAVDASIVGEFPNSAVWGSNLLGVVVGAAFLVSAL